MGDRRRGGVEPGCYAEGQGPGCTSLRLCLCHPNAQPQRQRGDQAELGVHSGLLAVVDRQRVHGCQKRRCRHGAQRGRRLQSGIWLAKQQPHSRRYHRHHQDAAEG